MADWYWTRGTERHGPIDLQALRDAIVRGEVAAGDLAWREGMPAWTRVAEVAELQNSAPAQVQVATPVPSPINYYGTNVFPPRAHEHLRGHAPPKGDVAIWPLDDGLFEQLKSAMKVRKRIYGAAQLYRSLLFLSAIGAGVLVLVAVFSMVGVGARGGGPFVFASMGIVAVVACGFCALYWVMWRFTMRSHRWAPLTFFILCMGGIALNFFGAAISDPSDQAGMLVSAVISSIFLLLFGVVSWRAFAAIPKYLQYPAWYQEIISAGGL